MSSAVKPTRVQTTGAREFDDLSRQVQEMSKSLGDGALKLDNLPSVTLPVFATAWAGLGVTLTRAPVLNVTERVLISAVGLSTAALAAHAVNYRSFTLERARDGEVVGIVASRDTTIASIENYVPFLLELARAEADLYLIEGDVLLFTVDGGGSRPAIGPGALTIYGEKVQ